jgi:alpha-L-fucosidase
VFGTRVHRDGAQWSAGRRQEVDTSTNTGAQYDVEKLTLRPDAGDARKEVLFTRKGENLYAILPRYPQGELRLRDLRLRANARVSLIGEARAISWSQRGRDVVIVAPPLGEEALTIGPRVFRLEGVVD